MYLRAQFGAPVRNVVLDYAKSELCPSQEGWELAVSEGVPVPTRGSVWIIFFNLTFYVRKESEKE